MARSQEPKAERNDKCHAGDVECRAGRTPHRPLRRSVRAMQSRRTVRSEPRPRWTVSLRLAARPSSSRDFGPTRGRCPRPRYGVRRASRQPTGGEAARSFRCRHLPAETHWDPCGCSTRVSSVQSLASGGTCSASDSPSASRVGVPVRCPQSLSHLWAP